MAVEQHIKQGDQNLKDKDYLSAIASFSIAIKENPKAFQAYIKRATAYQKLNNNEIAKKDISEAFTIAEERGKRTELGLCYFRLGIIYYTEKKFKLALKNFNKAIEYDCTEPTAQVWKTKVEYDLKKNPQPEESESESEDITITAIEGKAEASNAKKNEEVSKGDLVGRPSTNINVINKHSPLKMKIRDDWYQTNDSVIITIYAKNIKEDKLQIQFSTKAVSVSFPSSANSEYNYNLDPLYAEIDLEESNYRLYATKLELVLVKKKSIKWPTLEVSQESPAESSAVPRDEETKKAVLSYPTSSRNAVNWSTFKLNEEDEMESEKESDFFAKLYKDVDDDTKKAMMKSYVESNGTVLTTNWAEAKDKTFETSPPEGMVAKKWDAKD